MNGDVYGAMSKSIEDFRNVVWPSIGAPFGRLIPVESVTATAFAKELDTRAGIDAWIICDDGHMRGLASRVQWTDSSYETFTIRIKSRRGNPTEYDKRKREISARGAITPHYFSQGYVTCDRTRLVGAAIAPMADVIHAVEHGRGWAMPPNADGSQGYAVRWSALSTIRVWRTAGGQTWEEVTLL